MPFMILALVVAAGIAMFLWHTRIPALPVQAGDWGTPSRDDPRIAVAAMLRAVAGKSSDRLFSVRDAIGRLATSLADV